MKRHFFFIIFASLLICPSDIYAQATQLTAKEQKAAEKAARKAQKEADKAAKKAAKNNVPTLVTPPSLSVNPRYEVPMPELLTEAEKMAYLFGVSQSNGLQNYMQNQLGVDSAYVDDFVRGVMDRVNTSPEDKSRYAYNQGMSIGGQITQMTREFSNDYYAGASDKKMDVSIVAAGIVHGLMGTSEMSATDANAKFKDMMNEHKQQQDAIAKAEADATEKAFMEENKQDVGVVETASGLQYKVLTKGDGPIPVATDKVKVNYEGHLLDGTVFDSSYKRKEPATFKVNQVIKGWTEALCLMPVGSKWELYIPYSLAYGGRSAGQIPPYSTLIFTVELLSIEK